MLRRTGLRQAVRAVHYGLIALTAWAAAAVLVRLWSIDLSPSPPPAATSPADASATAARARRGNDDAVILKRNLFGATDLEAPGVESAPASGVDLRLRGIASTEGRSWAVFENTGTGEQNVFAVGDRVFDGPRLVAVEDGGAVVMVRGGRKRYEIEDEAMAVAEERRPRGERGGTKRGGDKTRAAGAGIRKTGEGQWLVDRREIEHTVANLNQVITQARAVPVLSGGKSAGFKLFNIRKGSIFDKIGLRDGDIIQRVNDTELTDPSKAVGLLEEIQSMGQIKLNLVRGGKLRTNSYTIR